MRHNHHPLEPLFIRFFQRSLVKLRPLGLRLFVRLPQELVVLLRRPVVLEQLFARVLPQRTVNMKDSQRSVRTADLRADTGR